MLQLHPLFPVSLIKVDRDGAIPSWVPSIGRVATKLESVQKVIREERIQRNMPYSEDVMGKRGPRFQNFEELCHTRLTCSELGLVGGRHMWDHPTMK